MNILKDNKGIVAIEMLVSFFGFMLFTLIIVTFINIASIQLRFHHALTQTAHEVALYSQVLEMFGFVDFIRDVERLAADTRDEMESVIGYAFGIMDDIGHMYESVGNLDIGGVESAFGSVQQNAEDGWEVIEGWTDNPFGFIRGLIAVAASESIYAGLSLFMGNIVAPAFFHRYLGFHDGITGREYVESIAIQDNSIDFVWDRGDVSFLDHLRAEGTSVFAPQGTEFLSGENADTIEIHIRYLLNLGRFFLLPDNFRFESTVRQEVKVRAWVGDGRSFDRSLEGPERN